MDASPGAAPGEEDDPDDRRGRGRGRRLRRRAGCVWGCLTEPLILVGLTLIAAIFGRACLVRRARRLRDGEQTEEEDEGSGST